MGSFENFAYNVLRLGVKRGRPPVFSAQQFYPAKEERELQETLKRELERLWTAALQVALQGIRDDVSDLAQIRAELSEDFVNNVNGIADKIIGNAQKSLVKFSEMTIGRPYYPGALEGSIKADWTATFQQLCISADTTAKAKIAQLVSQGKDQGMNKLQIEKLVKSELPADTAHRAELIARTETAKLNNAATMASYREAGIEYYKWLSCIDDRTRESHAKLNGKICAVGRPDVYFEENEENPLKPISHGRAGEGMYIGDPGTDFQCRCTCVPWDPRIDGKFEIKEAPEPKPKEPSKLEVAREETAAEKARAEEAERKLRLLQRSIERHSERTAKDVEGIIAAWEARNSKWRILHAAEKRHASRNEAKIIAEMQERIKVRAEGRAILAELEGISGIDLDKMREALKTGNVSEIKNAQKVLESYKSELLGFEKYVENPIENAKTYGFTDIKNVYNSIESKFQQWNGLPEWKLLKKYDFEANFVEQHKKYSTWKIAQKAYQNAYNELKVKVDLDNLKPELDDLKKYKSKAKDFVSALKDAETKFINAKTLADVQEAKNSIDAAIKIRENIEAKKMAKKIGGNVTQAQRDAAFWAKNGKDYYDEFIVHTGNVWNTLSVKEKGSLYYYTHTYCNINEPLRGIAYIGNASKAKEGLSKIPYITSALDKFVIPKDIWLQRGDRDVSTIFHRFGIDISGMTEKQAQKALLGKEGIEKAFLSCGSSKGKGFSGEVITNMYVPKGTKGAYVEPISHYGNGNSYDNWDGLTRQSSVSGENETLLQRGTKFRVTKVEKKGSQWYIDVDVIGQEPQSY